MKKVFFFLSTAAVSLLISCSGNNSGGKMSDKAQKNLDACNAVNTAITSGDVSKIGDYIATDAVDHGGGSGDVKGIDSIKASLSRIHTMEPDMKSEVVKQLADDDYAFQWMRYTGTASSASMGMPVGTKYDMSFIEVSKFNSDGKATDHWEFMQPSDMMKMMPPPPMEKMDTTKNKMK